jgi:hypothetical protein
VDPKERGEYPDYDGFFLDAPMGSLESDWDQRAYEALRRTPGIFDRSPRKLFTVIQSVPSIHRKGGLRVSRPCGTEGRGRRLRNGAKWFAPPE